MLSRAHSLHLLRHVFGVSFAQYGLDDAAFAAAAQNRLRLEQDKARGCCVVQ